jgi:DeoR family transcriptional regulator, aga operon transcriptional repressor
MSSNGLLNEERRREILGVLHRDGRVLVKDLARQFRISQITIRKDLEFLDGQGVIQRTHGGALPVQSGALLDPTLREKENCTASRRRRLPSRPLAWSKTASRCCWIPERPQLRLRVP